MIGRFTPLTATAHGRAMLAAAILGLTGCGGLAPSVPAEPPVSVLLVTIDTLRADRADPDGPFPDLTPNLAGLARRGVRFTDATAHAPLTFPSHVSIMTGLFPSAHGARDNGSYVLRDEALTLAELLKARGYRTAAFVASFVLARGFGLAQGFDTYGDQFDVSGSRYSFADLQRRGAEVAGDTAAWLEAAAADPGPVFVWMHLYDPHAPYEAPKAFADRHPGQPYNAEVAAADWAVGYVLDRLPDQFRDHMLVIVTSDHGEGLGDHGEPEHGIFLYDSTLHVPLIIAGAGLPAGRIVREQVRLVDLMPTILDLTGTALPEGLAGESLAPLARGAARAKVPASYAESWFQRLHFGWSELRAVRTGGWKFVQAPRPELYDLRTDQGESDNRVSDRTGIARRLAAELRTLGGGTRDAVASAQTVDSQTAERLRSLGYLGGGSGALAGPGGGDDPKDRIEDYVAFVTGFYDALNHLEGGRYARALAGFESLARRYPTSFEAHQFAGRALASLGRREDALGEYEIAIGLNPSFAATFFDAARVEASLGRIGAARARVADGLAMEPDSFYGAFVRGLVESHAGDADAAARAFERALALNSGLAPAHFELGRLAEDRGDRDEALAHYRRALDADVGFREARDAVERLEGRGGS